MYIPNHFKEEDKTEIEKLVREFSFATLVSIKDNLPWATHIPLEVVTDENGNWFLHGHVSKANPQWKTFETMNDVLAIFMGPHSYISPSWYNHRNVPTWNYKAVHLYGKATLVEGDALEAMLQKLMKRYEDVHAEKPQGYNEIPAHTLEKDLRGVVGFEIKVERVEAISKLSQNRDAESHQSVVDHLKKMDAYDAKRIAEEMEKTKP
ncbi:MAG TPA: FMN-binding negative transcriptional regulator [Chitinophagales bacterium]|nr:FMN-binding negative transcriptional regulator [Chitinophagales bacterium]